MFAPTKLKSVWILACLLTAFNTHAQTASSKTLGDLIDQAKRSKSLGSGVDTSVASSGSPKKSTSGNKSNIDMGSLPMLWSLSGANNQLVAEIIYKETVYTLRLHDGEKKVGPWLVDRYGTNGLYITPAAQPPKNSKRTSVFLPAPAPGGSLEKYAAVLPAPLVKMGGLDGGSDGFFGMMGQNIGGVMPPQILGAANAGLPANAPSNNMPGAAPPASKTP
jgi:hypothetical protein